LDCSINATSVTHETYKQNIRASSLQNNDANVHRTNNDLEGYHNRVFKKFGRRPNFWKFIKRLQEEQLSQDQLFSAINNGTAVLRQRAPKYRSTERTVRLAREDLEAQRITSLDFLERVSVAIANNGI
jgi:hypothetical protein